MAVQILHVLREFWTKIRESDSHFKRSTTTIWSNLPKMDIFGQKWIILMKWTIFELIIPVSSDVLIWKNDVFVNVFVF